MTRLQTPPTHHDRRRASMDYSMDERAKRSSGDAARLECRGRVAHGLGIALAALALADGPARAQETIELPPGGPGPDRRLPRGLPNREIARASRPDVEEEFHFAALPGGRVAYSDTTAYRIKVTDPAGRVDRVLVRSFATRNWDDRTARAFREHYRTTHRGGHRRRRRPRRIGRHARRSCSFPPNGGRMGTGGGDSPRRRAGDDLGRDHMGAPRSRPRVHRYRPRCRPCRNGHDGHDLDPDRVDGSWAGSDRRHHALQRRASTWARFQTRGCRVPSAPKGWRPTCSWTNSASRRVVVRRVPGGIR